MTPWQLDWKVTMLCHALRGVAKLYSPLAHLPYHHEWELDDPFVGDGAVWDRKVVGTHVSGPSKLVQHCRSGKVKVPLGRQVRHLNRAMNCAIQKCYSPSWSPSSLSCFVAWSAFTGSVFYCYSSFTQFLSAFCVVDQEDLQKIKNA